MSSDNYILTKYKYEMGGYDLEDVIKLVEKNIITEEEFKSITDYHYQGIKESRAN